MNVTAPVPEVPGQEAVNEWYKEEVARLMKQHGVGDFLEVPKAERHDLMAEFTRRSTALRSRTTPKPKVSVEAGSGVEGGAASAPEMVDPVSTPSGYACDQERCVTVAKSVRGWRQHRSRVHGIVDEKVPDG